MRSTEFLTPDNTRHVSLGWFNTPIALLDRILVKHDGPMTDGKL
jgi:hypothetical protein